MRAFSSATLALMLAASGMATLTPSASQAQYADEARADYPPPPLPEYHQPPCPGYGYIWTPGYWAWTDYDEDYYWIPGTWVLPPQVGYLWTPGYWAFDNGGFAFNRGYWGLTVGFYGGIDYGYGYGGFGYDGGYWRGRDFFYNRRANNLRFGRFGNVYDREVNRRWDHNRASFNGGRDGVRARPSDQERAHFGERRLSPTGDQMRHFQSARGEPSFRAGFNHGTPPVGATPRPFDFRSQTPPQTPPQTRGQDGRGAPGYPPRFDRGGQNGDDRRLEPGDHPSYGRHSDGVTAQTPFQPRADQEPVYRGPANQGPTGLAPNRGGPSGDLQRPVPGRGSFGQDRSPPSGQDSSRPSFRDQSRPRSDFAAPPERQAPPPFVSQYRPQSQFQAAPQPAPRPQQPQPTAPAPRTFEGRPERPQAVAPPQPRPAPTRDREDRTPRGERGDQP